MPDAGLPPIVCEGAPRDLGFDQASRARASLHRQLRLGDRGRRGRFGRLGRGRALRGWRAVERDLARFYPHLSERTQGLGRGARVSRRALLVALARELGDQDEGVLRLAGGSALGVVPARTGRGPLLARSFDWPLGGAPDLLLRRSLPDCGYASLEVALPCLASALAGVNERGLAVAVTTIPAGPPHRRRAAAPAVLLVQECLARCDRVEQAVDWCRARPAGGRASLLLADAAGDLAALCVDGERRRVVEPSEGVVIGVGRRQTLAELDKCCREAGILDAARLRAILSSHGDDGRADENTPCRHGALRATQGAVCLDPRARRLELVRGAPCRAGPDAVEVASL